MRPITFALLVFLAIGVGACVPPLSPMERLAFSAHELNAATRFARMDVALSMVSEEAQRDFVIRHATWHREVRIVDVEVIGVQPITTSTADVQVAVGWHRLDDTTMRQSQLSQRWIQGADGWTLSEETRVGGAPGLFLVNRRQNKRPKLDGITTSSWE
jgi:hypothetical protein